MAVCPFHCDKNPSMKVDRRFHCFGCQADGDVIDFTAHLYNLKPKEAAEKLAEAAAAQQAAEKELLASLIFCEAGNQPYEGQVAVGAVVMNRIKSSSYPDTMEEVIYQSGQFSPAMSGWLDRVRANQGYTEAAMQAAEDALAGSNPIGDCLYFSVGGYGTRIGDHLFH